MPDFRLCSTYLSRSQASLYHYALCLIAKQAEETFGLLRYSLGGDRPSQTTHQTLSFAQFHELKLEHQTYQSGISPSTPS